MNINLLDREDSSCNTLMVSGSADFTERYIHQLRGGFGPRPAMPVVNTACHKKISSKSPKAMQMDKGRARALAKKTKR